MILTISVNRDSAGTDPWVTAVLPPAILSSLRDQPAYSVVIMTLTDGMLDSQEYRIIVSPDDDRCAWTLICGRFATTEGNGGIVRGEADSEDEAVLAGVEHATRLAMAEAAPATQAGDGFA